MQFDSDSDKDDSLHESQNPNKPVQGTTSTSFNDLEPFTVSDENRGLLSSKPGEAGADKRAFQLSDWVAPVEGNRRVILFIVLGLCFLILLGFLVPKRHKSSLVVLISLDGFRQSYLTQTKTLSSFPVQAKFLQPVFPTSTFPNHWTLATGLHPEQHGIVANIFYDPGLNETFSYGDPKCNFDEKWWHGTPIWSLADSSGVIMFPGSEQGKLPTHHVPYQHMSPEDKLEIFKDWMGSKDRPQFIAMYFPECDVQGHASGPSSPELSKTIAYIDGIIERILEIIGEAGMSPYTEVVVVSDHGMTTTSPDRTYYLDDIIDLTKVHVPEVGPFVHVWPLDDRDIPEIKRNLSGRPDLYRVYDKTSMPARFMYTNSSRIPPIVVISANGVSLTSKEIGLMPVGMHGWDNEFEDMHAVFLARGPDITRLATTGALANGRISSPLKGKTLLKGFGNFRVKSLLCFLLGKGWACDGKLDKSNEGWEWVES